MKVKVTTVEEVEINIEFPYYVKDSCHYWKVLDEKTGIKVTIYSLTNAIELGELAILSAFDQNNLESNEAEFKEKYAEVLTRLNNSYAI